ncbi:carbohydrate ABC transporter permease [Isoptericola sp. NPDC057391]|uniref:carbohydrate ABC transporter permease n=1 Tax=Isoptericola sp. NPDC057391 TaxID=3346117 RepID=UPI0036337E45
MSTITQSTDADGAAPVEAVAGPPGRRPARRRREEVEAAAASRGANRWFVLAALFAFVLYSVGPVWWLIVAATKTKQQLYRTNGLWFADLNLVENLQALFTYQDAIYPRWLANTALYGLASSVGLTLVSLAAGYGLARYSYRGKGLTMAFVIGSFLIPGVLLTIPSYLLYVRLGIFDTVWSMILPGFFSAFSVYLAKVYAQGAVPAELMEAARLDGAGEYRIFFQIGLRLLSTAGATIFLLHFVGTWNAFMGPLVFLRTAEKWPVMVGLYSWLQRGTDSQYDLTGLVITGALVASIPMVLLMISMQRYWKSGVTLGSLK